MSRILSFSAEKTGLKMDKNLSRKAIGINRKGEGKTTRIPGLPSQSLTWNHKMMVSKNGISKLPGDDFQVNHVSTSGVFF